MRKKYKNYSSRGLKNKVKELKNDVQSNLTSIRSKLFNQKIYLKGQEPPKSYAFQKKFLGLYFFFIFYSFVFLWGINDPENILIKYLTFGNPFGFGNALITFFLTLSIILNFNKIRYFIFEKYTIVKQILIFGLIFIGFYYIFDLISTSINFISYFLGLSFIWIVFLSSRFYIYSRKFSTQIESKFIEKYSKPRYFIVLIIPSIVAIALVFIALLYRTFLVYLALDFFGPSNPSDAIEVYKLEMTVIMPLIYFNLVMVIIFLIVEFMSTRRKAETKRIGAFDNFTFSLIIFFIFFFQIFQLTIFMLLQPQTLSAIKSTLGANSTVVTSIFIIEFVISMLFLYRIIIKLGKSYGWQFLFFKRDGLILFFLGCVLAQTLARFTLANGIPNQEVTILGNIFMADKSVISVLMIVFLGITLLIYYIKPHQTSMFMRMQKATINKEEESMEIVYKLIRGEYIRRGEAFPIEILERELIKATKLSKAVLYSLIKKLAEKDINISISETKDEFGNKIKWINFISVTEQFEKKEIAEKKAKKYLSERLVSTTSKTDRDLKNLGKNLTSDKASDQFIASLTSTYEKKKKHKQERVEKLEKLKKDFPFKAQDLNDEVKNRIIKIMKNEYKLRIEESKYSNPYIPVTQIAEKIRIKTKIPLGFLYLLLEHLSKTNMELKVIPNPENEKDKKIRFIPFYDFEMSNMLLDLRPHEYGKVRNDIIRNFVTIFKNHDPKKALNSLHRKIKAKRKKKAGWKKILEFLKENYDIHKEQYQLSHLTEKLRKNFETIRKIKKTKILSSKTIPETNNE